MCKRARRIWCILLVIIMIANMLPVHVLAAKTNRMSADKVIADDSVSTDDLYVLEEIVDRRTEYTKEFRLNNGFRVASVYAYPVHYVENGEWKEIDNTLKLSTAKSGNTYTNTAGIWDVSFPQSMTRNSPVSVTKDRHTLSFWMTGEMHSVGGNLELKDSEIIELPTVPDGPILEVQRGDTTAEVSATSETTDDTDAAIMIAAPAEAVAASVETIDVQSLKVAEQYPEMVAEKLSSRLRYANVYENTDIVFDMTSSMVKESVVLKEYDNSLLGYTYALDTGAMVPVLQENGGVELLDPVSEELIMYMPAPYLIDNTGVINHEVKVSLGGNEGSYILTYTLPQEWLADDERQWPVILDPAIRPSLSINNIEDVTIHSGGFRSYADEYLHCGYYHQARSMARSRILVKYTNLPELGAADVLIYAQATLNFVGNDALPGHPQPVVEVHKVNGTWTSRGVTWGNFVGYNETVEDHYFVNWAGTQYWDVTDIARDWYETGVNTGMLYKLSDEAEKTKKLSLLFRSSDHSSYIVAERPSLTLIFRNNSGLESYWDYTPSSAGRAGTGYVNQYTGNLVWTRNDIGFGGNRMPVSISHVYNANDNTENLFGMGYGWRTTFNQRVYKWNASGAYGNYYVWEDSDGTDHYFRYVSTNTYKDEDGLELTLTIGSTDAEKYTIIDKYGNKSIFDGSGRLTKQINNQATPSNITITYTTQSDYLISAITDGAGRIYTFSYNESNLLNQISYTGIGTTILSYVNFTYDENSNLVTVINKDAAEDPEKGISTYTYAENHLLQSAQDIDGYKLTYQYTTTVAGQPNRVKTISESDGTVLGTNLSFEYAHNQTKLTEFYESPDDEENRVIKGTQLIQFNNMGNTVSVQDDQGHAQYAQYAINDPATDETGTANATETGNTAKGNQLKLASRLQNTVANLLTDSGFENDSTWTKTNIDVAQTIDSGEGYLGSKSLKVTNSVGNSEGVLTTFTAAGNSTYTFSAYVKVNAGSAYLAIKDGSEVVVSEELKEFGDWKRLEVNYSNSTSSTKTLSACLLTAIGTTAYLDCTQVEKAPTASRYNILQNGDFAQENNAWSSAAGRTNVSAKAPADQLDANVYTLTGDPMTTNRISQTVNLSGSEGDTYVLAGWAKADSVPIKDDREFGLIATFMNGETVVNESTVRFNECADSTIEWQYAAAPVVAMGTYDAILIEVAYDYNANTAYFDGIQLFKEEFGKSYTYDEDGNIVSIVDLQKQETTYKYVNNNLTEEVLPTGAKLTYEYDDYHNVKKAISDTGVVYEFTYDEYGNNTSVSITSGEVKLTSTAVYKNQGNYLESTTDAAGNTTTYNYDPDTGVLLSVQYPNDGDTASTIYSYDNMYRIASAVMNNGGTTLSASYTYENDLLKKITTGSTVYNFDYGDFSLRSSVSVGSQHLAEYTYDEQDHNLTRLEYGNDDFVSYTYDDHSRLTTQSYEDNDKVEYQYDNNGALAVVSDSGSGITTTYYYDFTDRLMKYAEKGSGFSHIVGYEYDNINNLTALVETINGTGYTTSYAYDDDNRITGVTNGNVNESYSYDGFGRVSGKTTTDGTTNVLTETFEYITDTTNATTSGQVRKLTIDAASDITFEYTYDANGNITQVTSEGKTTRYTYDKANQLIREDNEAANASWTWEYDNAGNILSRSQYAYTTGELGTATGTISYTYGNDQWGDLLTAYNGTAVTHDQIGNMLTFSGWTFTWEHGRELASMSKDGTTWTNTYNADGLRTKRTNGSTTYQYVYNGSSLSQMTVGTHLLNFAYDASGSPMAVVYDGTTYYYVTNLQGDIVAILDSAGTAVVKYSYDAWGKPLTTSGAMATTLGVHNPLRYRGYVYDDESALYYLLSRYYDPALGRFINADAFASTGQGLLGNNMFAYCNNSPVFFTDSSGQSLVPHTYVTSDCRTGLTPPYITDQDDPEVADMHFGLATVSHGGCGAVASYNALVSMGHTIPFNEVVTYYNNRMAITFGFGLTGLLPYNIKQYFTSLGFTVVTTNQKEQIDLLSQTADGCIMYYKFPYTYRPLGIPINAYGAHFVEYHREDSNYVAVNTNAINGKTPFIAPSEFGYAGSQYDVIGIFIFK